MMPEPKEKEEMMGYTPVDLAKNLADVLKFELHYEKKKGWEFKNTLCDAPPPRDNPIFKRKREAIKENLSKPLENQKLENQYRRLFRYRSRCVLIQIQQFLFEILITFLGLP